MSTRSEKIIAKAKNIKCIISDVDGVMTNGDIIYDNNGLESKHFSVKDGQIIKYLKSSSILIGVITGRDSQVVKNRCRELEMDFHFHGIKDKNATLNSLLEEYHLELNQVAYIGDDLNDLPVLSKVGLSATPADGHFKVKKEVDLVLNTQGGKGALRELSDIILDSQDLYDSIISKLLE